MGSNPASGINRLMSAFTQPWGALTTPGGITSVTDASRAISPKGEVRRILSPSSMPRTTASAGLICSLGSGSRLLSVSSCRP